MTHLFKSMRQLRTVGLVLPMLMGGVSLTQAQAPAQVPLLTKSGTGVPPNIVLTMDDSGSMAFAHMPEDVFASDTFATANPVNSRTVRWDPNDNYNISTNFTGTVPGNFNSANWVLKAMRSPDTNTVFYNPEIRYDPWFTNDGVTRRANSPVAKAYKNPLIQTGAANTFVDLTATVAVPVAVAVSAGALTVGRLYKIVVRGTTDFRTVGSGNNNVGTIFRATGTTGGSGTAILVEWCYANSGNVNGVGTNVGDVANNGCQPVTTAFTHDPGVYFRLQKTGTTYKAVNGAANYTGYSINSTALPFPKYAARTDCLGSTNCTQAEERQNYANWFSYYRNRNLLARGAMMEAFGPEKNTFRMGFGRINKGEAAVDDVNTRVIESSATYGGGGVRAFDAARKVNLFKWLDDLPASGGTPLVTAMESVGNYYSRTDSKGPWTDTPGGTTNTVADNKTCRRSYQIIMTDGYWNGTNVALGNVDNTDGPTITGEGSSYQYIKTRPYLDSTSNTLSDVAMYYWNRDLQPDTANKVTPVGDNSSFWQNMTNFTVGLGVRGSLNPATDLPALTAGTKTWPAAATNQTAANVDDLWHAAVNSRGQFFSAKDPRELSDAIKTALAGATGGSGATAGVATASTVLSATNRKYVPTFAPGPWSGDISANPLDASGQVSAAVWNAAARMPAWNARNIVTWDTGLTPAAAVAFKWDSMSATNKTALGTVAATHTSNFIDFLWGDHSKEGVGNPFRSRVNANGSSFILGDFVNANPVLVQSGFNGRYTNPAWGGANAYSAFLTAKAARTAVLFAGSNDGMLHGFKDSKAATPASALTDGQEVFAYVPRAVYANLDKLADKDYGSLSLPHQFFVDGPLTESDAYIKAPNGVTSWRNYLTGTLGAGGRAVYALDVTDLANLGTSSVRWEISDTDDADLGYVLSPIRVGVLANGKWVAIFGNGYSSTNGYSTLFVVDLETAAINKLTVDTGGGNGMGGVTLIHDSSGYVTTIYAGDLKGNLWKLNYDAGASSKFSVAGTGPIFRATDGSGTAQPIISSPAVFNHSQGGQIIVFGTGKLFTTTDASDTSNQSIYGVWDKPADTILRPLFRSNLSLRTLSAFTGTGGASATTFYELVGTTFDYATNRGWYLELGPSITGGRVIYPTQVASFKTALVSSVAPVQGTPAACDSGSGTGLNMLLPVELGTLPGETNTGAAGVGGAGTTAIGRSFDTDGNGVTDSSDRVVVGYGVRADGIDAIVRTQTTNGSDPILDAGGGGGQGDCTGTNCSGSGGSTPSCLRSPACLDPSAPCLVSIQSASAGMKVCQPEPPPATPVTGSRTYDRVWRRIINPPIQ